MLSPASLPQASLYFILLISFAQTSPQRPETVSKVPRIQTRVEHLYPNWNPVNPIYPKESRLARTEGVVKVILIIGLDGSAADVRAISGDPVLLDCTISAVRQWRFQSALLNGEPAEIEVPLTFTFSIQDPPKPAYLYLKNGDVIRADKLREFTDTIEYTSGRRIHNLSPDSVRLISACGHNCVPGGGVSFNIVAIPLLPANKTGHSNHPVSR
jgi:TonB family protein